MCLWLHDSWVKANETLFVLGTMQEARVRSGGEQGVFR